MIKKQQKHSNQNNYELIDQEDVLNSKHTSKQKIEAEMLQHNKCSFAIKFSTDSKNVSLSVKNGRDASFTNHAERHYKTGYTQKSKNKSSKMLDGGL